VLAIRSWNRPTNSRRSDSLRGWGRNQWQALVASASSRGRSRRDARQSSCRPGVLTDLVVRSSQHSPSTRRRLPCLPACRQGRRRQGRRGPSPTRPKDGHPPPKEGICKLESTIECYGTLADRGTERRLQGTGRCWPSCEADSALVKRPWAPSRFGSKSRWPCEVAGHPCHRSAQVPRADLRHLDCQRHRWQAGPHWE
jgi:hypothetical protein